MVAITTDKVISHTKPWEGSLPYMYLDTSEKAGGPFVTVGIGVLITSKAELRTLLGYFHAWDTTVSPLAEMTGKPRQATQAELETVYDNVLAQQQNQRQKPRRAEAFESCNTVSTADGKRTDIRLAPGADNILARSKAQAKLTQLRALFPNFDTFPASAQLALFDMAFNMGTGIRSATRAKSIGLGQFWNLIDAANAGRWNDAANECSRRPPVPEDRNRRTRELFRAAVDEARRARTPPPAQHLARERE